jgi:hypothetical protein
MAKAEKAKVQTPAQAARARKVAQRKQALKEIKALEKYAVTLEGMVGKLAKLNESVDGDTRKQLEAFGKTMGITLQVVTAGVDAKAKVLGETFKR